MDELLKAYAERRRKEAGAPLVMHPATRQMLQAEVARVTSRTAAKAGRPRFFSFGRLFLYGSGLAAAMICAAFLIKEQNPLPPSVGSPQKIAATNPDKVSNASAAPPTTGNLVTLNNSTLAKDQEKFAVEGEVTADKKLALNKGSIAMQTDKDLSMPEAAKPEGGASVDLAQNSLPAAPAIASAQPAPVERAAPVPADRLLAPQAMPQSQQAPGSSPASPVLDAAAASPAGILALFEIQLNGDQIRLIDADGSVYTGKIDLPKSQQQYLTISKSRMFSNHAAFAKEMFANIQQQSAYSQQGQVQAPSGVLAGVSNSIAPVDASLKTDQAAQQQQGFPFRASGNCRSLARFLNVEGTYYADVPQEQSQKDVARAKQQTAEDVNGAAMGGASAGARIQGQAQIGNDVKIDINAISVPLKTKSN